MDSLDENNYSESEKSDEKLEEGGLPGGICHDEILAEGIGGAWLQFNVLKAQELHVVGIDEGLDEEGNPLSCI